jgi:hypothetical protein
MSKICCLRPTPDEARRRAALSLARKAVELGKNHEYLNWFLMTLGMAEYRSGHFAEADAALIAADKAAKGNPYISGISAFYRAMSLYRQGKEDEARQLATEAASKMKPLPKNEKNPLADNAREDELILWMAYKEVKAMFKFEPASSLPSKDEGVGGHSGQR